MTHQTSTQLLLAAMFLARVLLGVVAVLGTVGGLLTALIMSPDFFGPTAGDVATRELATYHNLLFGDRALTIAAVSAVGAPLTAILLAWLSHDRNAVARWTGAFAVGLIAAGIIVLLQPRYLHQCMEYSAGPEKTRQCVMRGDELYT